MFAKQVHLHNVLFSSCQYPVANVGTTNSLLTGEHVTADGFTAFYASLFDLQPHVCLTNSILTGGGLLNGYQDTNGNWVSVGALDTNHVFYSTDAADIFLSLGVANYYLPPNSSLRQAGTTSISPRMTWELTQKSTWPPLLLANTHVGGETQPVITLSPTVPRDTNRFPDLGYHYAPLDYGLDYYAVSNATLVITQGTVICYAYTEGAIWLGDGAEIQCVGDPLARNIFVSYAAVGEQPISAGDRSGDSFSRIINASRPNGGFAPGTFRFTDFLGLPGDNDMLSADSVRGYSPLALRDCRLVNAIVTWLPEMSVTNDVENNVFEYGSVVAEQGVPDGLSLVARNNLFHHTSMHVAIDRGWTIQGNAFDGVTNFQISVGTSITLDHNAYLNGTAWPTNWLPQTSDIVTNLTWVAGPLGNYYQPPDSPLIDKGSTDAGVLGLYWHTTQTNQLPEVNSIVDIGSHYVALDASGNPIDTDADGVPNYLPDPNGIPVPDYIRYLHDQNPQIPYTVAIINGVIDVQLYIEYLQGRNPFAPGTVTDTNGAINLQTYTPLQ
jgi:hypothetical protein